MTTRICWTLEHIHQAAREIRFRAAYWWLNNQAEFLYLRLRLRSAMASMDSHPMATAPPRAEFYPLHPL